MPTREYVYRITEIVKVVDGDSYWLRVDVGFRQWALIYVRLAGYDCPESNRGSEFEKAMAIEARLQAQSFFYGWSEWGTWIRTEKDSDNFGRWLGHIWMEPDPIRNLGELLRERGLASVWPTRWRDEYDLERKTE